MDHLFTNVANSERAAFKYCINSDFSSKSLQDNPGRFNEKKEDIINIADIINGKSE
ncbi:hypothetical protein J6590_024611 [Homalodisca vitripennis]|nr:hypothetical protein J6590_024611 [Homalodisca vitripennis]